MLDRTERHNALARIEGLRDFWALTSTGLLLLMDPAVRADLRSRDYHQIGLPRPDCTQVTILLDDAFAAAATDPQAFNLTYLRMLAGMVVTSVDNDVKRAGFSRKDDDPDDLQVLRHLRNAAAHASNSFLLSKEDRPVTFRELTIDYSMNEMPNVFFDHASPSLVLDLVEAVAQRL